MTQPHIKNYQINSPQIKNQIFRYLHSNVTNPPDHDLILKESDLDIIKNSDYIICPKFNGIRSWIICMRIENVYYSIIFPRYNRKPSNIVIKPLEIPMSKMFYHGTILEGIHYLMDDVNNILIDEVYMIGGEDQTIKSKEDRLNYLSGCLMKGLMRNSFYNIFVSQFFQVDKNSIKELYQKIKSDTTIQGIIFYPKIYKQLKIFTYTILDSDLENDIIKISSFKMIKTPKPDVYDLLSMESSNEKVDIALVPDMESSKKYKSWFNDSGKKKLQVRCRWHEEKKKWIPIEVVNK